MADDETTVRTTVGDVDVTDAGIAGSVGHAALVRRWRTAARGVPPATARPVVDLAQIESQLDKLTAK